MSIPIEQPPEGMDDETTAWANRFLINIAGALEEQEAEQVDLSNRVETLEQSGGGSGDMLKANYDTNDNGIVDDSEKLGGKAPEEFKNVTTKTTDSTGDLPSWAAWLADTSTAAPTRAMNPAPVDGEEATVFDVSGNASANNITLTVVAPTTISHPVISTDGESVKYRYDATGDVWDLVFKKAPSTGGGGSPVGYTKATYKIPASCAVATLSNFPVVLYGDDLPQWLLDAIELDTSKLEINDITDPLNPVALPCEVKFIDAAKSLAWIHFSANIVFGEDFIFEVISDGVNTAPVTPILADYVFVVDFRRESITDVVNYGTGAGQFSNQNGIVSKEDGLTNGATFVFDATETVSNPVVEANLKFTTTSQTGIIGINTTSGSAYTFGMAIDAYSGQLCPAAYVNNTPWFARLTNYSYDNRPYEVLTSRFTNGDSMLYIAGSVRTGTVSGAAYGNGLTSVGLNSGANFKEVRVRGNGDASLNTIAVENMNMENNLFTYMGSS